MNIVIPFGRESKKDETALRYCLKSLYKYVPGVGGIYVIGEKPLLQNVIHIPFTEIDSNVFRDKNMYDKILLACNTDAISDPFLLVYDDYILLQPYQFKTYHSGVMSTKPYSENLHYYNVVRNTIKLLGKTNNYDTHSPMLIWKEDFKKINIDWSKPYGYCIMTLYCYLNDIEGEYHKDFKLYCQNKKEIIYNFIKDEPLFSLPSSVKKYTKEVLSELFD